MKKEIKFSAKLDSAEFDRSIEQMQRKLKEIYAPADSIRQQSQMASRMESMGMPGQMSKPTQQQYQQTTQSVRRDMDQMLATEVRRQESLSKTIEGRIGKVKSLREEQEKLTKGSAEELAIKEKISRMEGNNNRLREIERGRSQAINQTMDARQTMNPSGFRDVIAGYRSGGIGGAASAGKDILKSMSPSQMAGMIGTVIASAGIATKIGGELYRDFKQAPINTASSYGNAMAGVLGREVNAAYSGRSGFEMAFMPEKQKALAMAREGMKGERVGNVAGVAGTMIASTGVGTGIGAVLGGPIGALAGGALGAGYGAYKSMTGEGGAKQSALVKGAFSSTHKAEYEGMMAQDFAQKYAEALEAQKNQNPFKLAAAEHYDANYMRHLGSQRSMGLENYQFHGLNPNSSGMGDKHMYESGRRDPIGYRERAINEGFTDDMAMGASSGILGAGGSTSMARNSVFALQAGRQFNQTNASGVLGNISNSLGSSQASESAYIKMLAEGTRQGLDTSTYAAESRQMMEVTSQAISRSGTSDVDRIISQMGGFLNEKTGRGIQSAKEAFDYYNQASSDTGGPRGVQRAAGAMRNEILGKMDTIDRNSIMSFQGDQLDPNSLQLKRLAEKYDTTPQKIIDERLKVDKQGFNFRQGTDKAMNRATELRAALKTETDPKKREEMQKQLDSAMGDLEIGVAIENETMTPKQVASMSRGLTMTPGDKKKMDEEEAALFAKSQDKKGPRIEDVSVAGAAEGSRVALENFHKFAKELVHSPEAIREFNKEMAIAVEIINKLSPVLRAKALENLNFTESTNQSQSGKNSK